MASTAPQQGTGLAFLMVTSDFSGYMVDFSASGWRRGATDTTHSEVTPTDATTKTIYRTFDPSKIVDGGTYRLVIHFDRNLPPITAARETLRITFPLASGEVTAAKVEISGFITDVSRNLQPLSDDTMRMEIEFKVSGAPTYTAAS